MVFRNLRGPHSPRLSAQKSSQTRTKSADLVHTHHHLSPNHSSSTSPPPENPSLPSSCGRSSPMELNGSLPSRSLRHRRSPSSDRFLAAYPHSFPEIASSSSAIADGELNEDDIFTTDISSQPLPSLSSSPSPSPSVGLRRHPGDAGQRLKNSFKGIEASGILAALPESSENSHQFFSHKAALSTSVSSNASSSSSGGVSASSSSSARMMLLIPKPPQERVPFASSSGAVGKFPQSAPVNVPVLSQTMRRRRVEFDEVDVDEGEEEEGEMLPPHEIVARSLARSPLLSSSVLEGAGRTLKGRDLRQVRNAVFRRTGFLD